MTDDAYPLPKAQSMSAEEFARLKAVVAGSPTDDELARLEAVARAATPGPWEHVVGSDGDFVEGADGGAVATFAYCYPECAIGLDADNAAHIATFDPPTVLALLVELRDLRTRYNRAYKAIQAWEDGDQFTAGYEVGYNDGESSAEADLAARLDP
jgi:hypothetical protein